MLRSSRCARALLHGAVGLLAVAMLTASSCNNDDHFDDPPPSGQGSIIIDNNTSDDISVFIDGVSFPEAKDGKNRTYDLDPGVYRVVLDQQGGDHTYRDDIDVIESRNTVLDVAFGDGANYDVIVFFE